MARAVSEAKVHHLLRAEASHDELTGLGNLRFLRAHLSVEIARAERHAAPLSLVMIDLDKLKQINDQLGHLAGSAALRGVADVLRHEVRETDLPVRFGGDEFVVVLPHTNERDAIVFAERALAQVRRLDVGGGSLSVSVGVASFQSGRRESGEDLLRRADAAAYRAKRSGGGRVCFDEGKSAGKTDDQGQADETGS
jgi:diguanylate cyclase (GGDEF)-like protein